MTQHAPAEHLRVVRTTSSIRFLSNGCRVGLSASDGLLVECPLPRSGSHGCSGVSSVPGSVRLPILGGPHVEYDGGDCPLFVRVRTGYVTRRCVSTGDWVPTSDWTDTQAVEAHEAAARAAAARRRRSLLALRQLRTADAKLMAFGRAWWSAVAARVYTRWVQAAPQIEFDPSISPRDLSLARRWIRPRASDDDHDRVREARRAELSAAQYYTHRRHDVRDVSSEQLEPVSDGAWITHDLEIDRRPVDVKNVRDAKFGGFIVRPSPKRTKKENEEVAVCGVVEGRRVVGEASGEALADLQCRAKKLAAALGLSLRISSMASWRRSLGPWLMDYTPEHYRSFDRRSVRSVLEAAARVPEIGVSPSWATAFAVFWSTTDGRDAAVDPVDVSAPPLDVFVRSSSLVPRTRPGLFFFVLIYLLALARRGAWRRDVIKQELFDFLFLPRSAGQSCQSSTFQPAQWPLGLHDPLELVRHCVETLDSMVGKNAHVLQSVSSLVLFGTGVLRARCFGDGPLFTLLAYCGGCGKRPLWLRELDPALLTLKNRLSFGRLDPSPLSGNLLCPNCLKLICDACGFCEDACSLNPSGSDAGFQRAWPRAGSAFARGAHR